MYRLVMLTMPSKMASIIVLRASCDITLGRPFNIYILLIASNAYLSANSHRKERVARNLRAANICTCWCGSSASVCLTLDSVHPVDPRTLGNLRSSWVRKSLCSLKTLHPDSIIGVILRESQCIHYAVVSLHYLYA